MNKQQVYVVTQSAWGEDTIVVKVCSSLETALRYLDLVAGDDEDDYTYNYTIYDLE